MTIDWLAVRNFGRVKYFNLSYAVLLIVPLLALTCHSLRTAEALRTYIPLPAFPLTVQLLYVASALYAVAIAVYQYACPSIIKQYETEEDYVTALRPILERAYPDRMFEIVMANLTPEQEDTREQLRRLSVGTGLWMSLQPDPAQTELKNALQEVYPGCIQRYLARSYSKARTSRRGWAWTSATLYMLATLIMVGLLVNRTWVVITA